MIKYILRTTVDVIVALISDILLYPLFLLWNRSLRIRFNERIGLMVMKSVGSTGINSKILGWSIIRDPHNLSIGSHVSIGEGAYFFCKGGIEIDDNTQISRNCVIYSANHDIDGDKIPYDDNYIERRVKIGKSVWIGMNVCITPGVQIGDGAIIGMGSVISKNVGKGEVVVGTGQRVVSGRDLQKFDYLERSKSYFGLKK